MRAGVPLIKNNLHRSLIGLGGALVATAVITMHWECPSERDDYVRGLWIAGGTALAAVIGTGAGLVLWYRRDFDR